MGCVLGQHDESGRKEHAIYYLSKKFTDCEQRYSLLEKTCRALAWAARRLRQYMLTHTTLLISKMDPVKYIFEKPALTGKVTRWQMILTEYDIQYREVSCQTILQSNRLMITNLWGLTFLMRTSCFSNRKIERNHSRRRGLTLNPNGVWCLMGRSTAMVAELV